MENKEIIIDGVDVSGCEDYGYRGKARYWCHNHDEPCTDYPNCLFKQLARKTQECEKLRTDIKDIANLLDLDTGEEYNFGNIEIAIKGLKQECERWKSNFNGKVSAIEELLKKLDQLKAENNELKEKVKELRQGWINCDKERNLQEANSEFRQRVINRYKQTLAEIKDIAKNMNNECFYDDFECKYCDMKNGCTYHMKIKILQKISECEGTNEN